MALCAEVVAAAGLSVAKVPAVGTRVLTGVGERDAERRTPFSDTRAEFSYWWVEHIDKRAVTNRTHVVLNGNVVPT